ncbi:recombinase family protein [Brevibacillus parabrevis]|uniref:recombinase family protein n=1 Tax=Brevibacillus parabrevis TaxID=54914 RepID=UPI0028D14EA9|nr:recombinase family protein [Brevibacillus parabrevis]
MRVAIYARVSTKKEEQKNSLENQIAYATDLIVRNGWTVAGRYIDDGISGATIFKRKELQRLLEDARKKKFDAIVAKSVSRLGRNTVENVQTTAEIEGLGIRLILPEDNYDSATRGSSKLMFNLKAVLAEEECAKFSERIKLGRQASARQGKYQASLPALGYKRNDKGELVIDEEHTKTVRKIFHLYLHEEWGWFKINNYLSDNGVPTPRAVSGASNAGVRWHQSSVKTILKNIIYTGTIVQHCEETVDSITKKRKRVDAEKQIIHHRPELALITMEEYQAVQERMRIKGKNKSNGQESLFAHIAVCADCGKGMTFRKDRGKEGAYVCGGYVKYTTSFCSSHLIKEPVLLGMVKDDLRELISSNVKPDKLYSVLNGELNLHQSNFKKELQKVNNRLSQLNDQFQGLLQLYAQKAVSIEQFTIQNERIQGEQSKLAKQKAQLESQQEAKKHTDDHLRAFKRQIDKFARLDIEDERVMKQLLQTLIHKIEVHKDGSIKIHYNITRPHLIGA